MRKLSLKSQLFLLFTISLLFATIVFSIITISSTIYLAENEVYSRLSSFTFILDSMNKPQNSPEGNKFPDMEVSYYINRNNEVTESNLDAIGINDTDIVDLINELKNETDSNKQFRIEGNKEINSKTIYYICQIRDDSNYSIILTNDVYVSNLVKDIAIRMIIVFMGLVFFEILIVSVWSNRYVNRIRRLQLHILDLPKNKYEKSYVDKYEDEIGELSNSIEKMREELNNIELTKQEMLQNLSHDFKTPISVIKSYAEAIQDGIEDDNALNIIINQADILQKKVIKLLQYNSIEYLDHTKEFEKIKMSDLINDVVLKYKHQSNINISLDLEDISFNGYKENWDIVISNILENALRYAKNEIKIILREKRIRIYNDGDHIDDKFIQKSFKPYEKGDKGQFGLGMSIVVKTCNFFGYNVKVQNENVGVSFIIEEFNRK